MAGRRHFSRAATPLLPRDTSLFDAIHMIIGMREHYITSFVLTLPFIVMSTLETSAPVAFTAAIAITSAMIATAIRSFASRIV
jgi:hypothetical protein